MAIYIALLRGINVGGNNMIKMAELKRVLQDAGLDRVQTYIQSGNVLFESEDGAEPLRRRIEHEILEALGKKVDVVLRTSAQLQRIIADVPFEADAVSEAKLLHVAMLSEAPSQEGTDRLLTYKNESELLHFDDQNIYVFFGLGVQDSKLANQFSKLGVPATLRNWNTMNKLMTLAKAMEGSIS
jgi:uncharacterized protein (DUF1697 family)